MKTKWSLLGAAFVLGMLSLMGCNGSGKTDTPAEQGAVNAANKTENAAKDVAKDVTAATVVTPKVQSALSDDPMFKDTKNGVINVDSKDNVVHLKGHVLTNDLKKHAGEVAQKVLTENHSTDTISNELMVDKH
jgi:osmotically-inducible protein OsmY